MKQFPNRIAPLFLTILMVTVAFSGQLTITTNTVFDELTIGETDIVIINSNVTLEVTGDVTITGELEMGTGSVADVTGAVTINSAGILDMNGTAEMQLGGDFTFNGTLQAESGTQITFDGGSGQTLAGSPSAEPTFNKVTFSGSQKIINLTMTIADTLDTGGQNVTISGDKTLTLGSNNVTILSGGDWTLTGTLSPDAASTIKYTSSSAQSVLPVTHGFFEHDGTGTLSLQSNLSCVTLTNTSGNFTAGSNNVTADGIVWTNGSITATPSGNWDIGSNGIDVNNGTFIATSGVFTIAGDWDFTGSGTFTPGTGSVDFDGITAQTITSNSQAFYSADISNIDNVVSIADKFEFDAGGTLTIDTGAIFATNGNEFDDNGGTIVNNGTFRIYGDETFTTNNLSIPGLTKFVDPEGATLTTNLAGLETVEFDSPNQTFTLAEDMNYITGNITVATNTTLNMNIYDITLANRKTITNNGTWSAPSDGSRFTCAGNATFLGGNMNFFEFYAASTQADTVVFNGAITYTVAGDLTLTGADSSELLITSETEARATAIINHTGTNQNVNYVKVFDVNGTEENHISATNSWSLGGTTNFWEFAAMLYTYNTSGNWDDAANWIEGVLPSSTDNILVDPGITLTINGNRTINDIDIDGTLIVNADTMTVNGVSDIASTGTITISSGALLLSGACNNYGTLTISTTGLIDADGNFNQIAEDAGTITLSSQGSLNVSGTVTGFGALSTDNGTVIYDGSDQSVIADTYYNLTIGGSSGTKSLAGNVTTNNNFTVNANVSAAVSDKTLQIGGAADINGTVSVSTGTIDANGAFDATGGNITFSGNGNLNVSGTVTGFGTLSDDNGTVTFDGVNQEVLADSYNNLIIGGSSGTKALNGTVTINNNFTVNSNVTCAVTDKTLNITGITDINGVVTVSTGAIDADGAFDATDGIITFSDAGNLNVSGTVTSFGTLSHDNGTLTYDGNDQTVIADTCYNLVIGGSSGTKTLDGTVVTNNNFTVDVNITCAVVDKTLQIEGSADINGTVTASTGTIDANGTFDATSGTITLTGTANLNVSGTVTSFGTLSNDNGSVTYDGGNQSVVADIYNNLNITGTASTIKTLSGAIETNGDLSIAADVTLDVSSGNDYSVVVRGDWTNNGTFDSRNSTVTFNGSANQVLIPGSSSFYNLLLNNNGFDDQSIIVQADMDVNNDLTLNDGTLDLATNNPNVNIGGNLSIASGAVWTKGTGTTTFDGSTTQTLSDENGIPNNLGKVMVD